MVTNEHNGWTERKMWTTYLRGNAGQRGTMAARKTAGPYIAPPTKLVGGAICEHSGGAEGNLGQQICRVTRGNERAQEMGPHIAPSTKLVEGQRGGQRGQSSHAQI